MTVTPGISAPLRYCVPVMKSPLRLGDTDVATAFLNPGCPEQLLDERASGTLCPESMDVCTHLAARQNGPTLWEEVGHCRVCHLRNAITAEPMALGPAAVNLGIDEARVIDEALRVTAPSTLLEAQNGRGFKSNQARPIVLWFTALSFITTA